MAHRTERGSLGKVRTERDFPGKARTERDSLGDVRVPAGAYWGAQTQRAIHNFPISGLVPDPSFVRAYVFLKRAAARVNGDLALIGRKESRAIIKAADEILAGKLADQFVVDPFQAGAGTSHHMNVNEVLANRANEILGEKKGTYRPVHPNNHVNFGQSTNDTFPTAMRLAILLEEDGLKTALADLAGSFGAKGHQFAWVATAGRTHLQDATPILMGQVFSGYADGLERTGKALTDAARGLEELGIGGTAVGTGVNRHREYPKRMATELTRLTGLKLRATRTPIAMHQSTHDFARFASAMKGVALETNRVADDLRLMSSGPTSGIGEINLPPVQPGSSIMPGKVNPVMAESLNMVCYHVIGAEAAVSAASQAGQFQLNVMMPVIVFEILFSLGILTRGLRLFRDRCVEGITVNEETCRHFAESTVALATMLNPLVGYDRAAEIAKRAVAEKRSIIEVAAEDLQITEAAAHKLLSPKRWTRPGIIEGA